MNDRYSNGFPGASMAMMRRATLGLVLLLPFVPGMAAAQGSGYWHTSGSQMQDANNKTVRIAAVNWYGFETTDQVVHGLWAQDYHTILSTIQAEGFNTIRIPFSNQMVETPVVPSNISFYGSTGPINTDLSGLNALQVLDKIVAGAGKLGLRVILDNHRSEAGNSNEGNGLWYTTAYPEANWIADWVALATRYKSFTDAAGNPTVVGVDLRNEPHLIGYSGNSGSCWTGDTSVSGCPASNTAQNWPAAATRAAAAVQKINPSLLIIVEGVDCYSGDCGWQGANLEGAGKYPVTLPVANELVYSAHDYGPDLYGQSWFKGSTTPASLASTWGKFWGYLSTGNTAPVWLGEFGTTNTAADMESNAAGSQGQWFQSLISYLGNNPSISWSYWALNGEDSFGLLDSNYDATPASALKEQMLTSIQSALATTSPTPTPTPTPSPTPTPTPTPKPCAAVPAVPGGLKATAGTSSTVSLSWTAVATPASCSVSYSVLRATGTAASTTLASGLTSASFSDTGLAAKTKYTYSVVASDANGNSKASAAANVTTPAAPVAGCHVGYQMLSQWPEGFQGAITIRNTGGTSLTNWTLGFSFSSKQTIANAWNTNASQKAAAVTMTSMSYNGVIAPGATLDGIGFIGVLSGTNPNPASFTLNGVVCK